MDWAAVIRDVAGGLLIAGALAAWVPDSFWRGLFLEHHATFAKIWGPLIGPAVAMLSFVCSIGNVPLAAVLWNGGISFGGVLAFIFTTFYATMAAAGLAVEFLFQGLGLQPTARNAKVVMAHVSWNYSTYLNIVFLAVAAVLVWRYFRRGGGWAMLKMMDEPMGEDEHAQHHHDHHEHDRNPGHAHARARGNWS